MIGSALTLFMTGILANNAHHTLPADHAAGFAEFLDRSTDFHGRNLGKRDTETFAKENHRSNSIASRRRRSFPPVLNRSGRRRRCGLAQRACLARDEMHFLLIPRKISRRSVSQNPPRFLLVPLENRKRPVPLLRMINHRPWIPRPEKTTRLRRCKQTR